eukprot:UN34439
MIGPNSSMNRIDILLSLKVRSSTTNAIHGCLLNNKFELNYQCCELSFGCVTENVDELIGFGFCTLDGMDRCMSEEKWSTFKINLG